MSPSFFKFKYMIIVKIIRETLEIAFDLIPLCLFFAFLILISQFLIHLYINAQI